MNIVALIHNGEKYIFLFGDTEADRNAAIRSAARMAEDRSLSFGWYAAALVFAKIRHTSPPSKRP